MDLSSLWNQLLLNPSTICLHPNSLIEGIQLSTPYVTSGDTNSSVSSESNENIKENELEEEIERNDDNDEIDKDKTSKKATQRVRYSKEEYKCTQCPYTCTTEKAFLHHLRFCDENTEKRLFSCQICGKDRKNEETLSIHMMKHKQEKYFCCDICKFKSLQLKKLIQHRRMHTGEKPHLCPFCSYRSSRRDNLRSHVRRVHKKQDLPCDTFTPRSMVLSPRKLK